MSYSKLHSTIVNSSLWTQADSTRLLFITLLAQADRDGCIYGSKTGLGRIANIEPTDIDEAFRVLLSPDDESSDRMRAPENNGCRIEEIPGGYRLLNHSYYRGLRDEDDRREQNRIAQEKFRQRAKPPSAAISQSKPAVSQHQPASASESRVKPQKAHTDTDTDTDTEKQPRKGGSLLRYVEEREAERKANFSGIEYEKALERDMRAAAMREGLSLTDAKVIYKTVLEYATLTWIDRFDSQQELNLDELAAALPPAALARKVIEECALPCNSLMTRAVAGAISFCVKVEERSNNAAVEFLIAKTRDEIERGGTVNNFWFDDRKWRIKANGKSDAVAERQKAGRAQIDRAAARHLARITNKDPQ